MNNQVFYTKKLFALGMSYLRTMDSADYERTFDLLDEVAALFPPKVRPHFSFKVGEILFFSKGFKKSSNNLTHYLPDTPYYQNALMVLHFPMRAQLERKVMMIAEEVFYLIDHLMPTIAAYRRGMNFFKLINEIRPVVVLDPNKNLVSYNRHFEREVFPRSQNVQNFMSWVKPEDIERVEKIFANALKGKVDTIRLPHPIRQDETNELVFGPLSFDSPNQAVVVIVSVHRLEEDIQAKYQLTSLELRIANAIQQGLQNKEIALMLGNSVETIKWHSKQIRIKLGVTGDRTPLRVLLQSYPPFIPHS